MGSSVIWHTHTNTKHSTWNIIRIIEEDSFDTLLLSYFLSSNSWGHFGIRVCSSHNNKRYQVQFDKHKHDARHRKYKSENWTRIFWNFDPVIFLIVKGGRSPQLVVVLLYLIKLCLLWKTRAQPGCHLIDTDINRYKYRYIYRNKYRYKYRHRQKFWWKHRYDKEIQCWCWMLPCSVDPPPDHPSGSLSPFYLEFRSFVSSVTQTHYV